jgi:hypothetical protein
MKRRLRFAQFHHSSCFLRASFTVSHIVYMMTKLPRRMRAVRSALLVLAAAESAASTTSLSSSANSAAASSSFTFWHITDVHVDPYYVTGSIAGSGCYCETHETCPRMPDTCVYTTNASLQAGPFGMPEDSCATPPALWASAMEFIAAEDAVAGPSPFTFFTGDFGEAGISASCGPTDAQDQVVGIVRQGMGAVRGTLPAATVYGVLGNHDSTPGDVFGSSDEMAWLYTNLTTIFGSSFPTDKAALASLLQSGWYATKMPVQTGPGLYVVALNTNYWTSLNSALSNTSGPAYALGVAQFAWLNTTLSSLNATGARAYIIGHIPPASAWLPNFYARYRQILTLYPSTVVASFFGHTHVDQFTIVRSCPSPTGPGPIDWVVTQNVSWCSGGNLDVGDVFGAGLWQGDAWCPLLPDDGGSISARITQCESVCGNASACAGFTWYPSSMAAPDGSCCFRTDVSDMPLNATSPAVCYAKPSCSGTGSEEDSAPLHMLYASPSLTEGYPASNPGLRRFVVDAETYELLDMVTYYGNITSANEEWAFVWEDEYSAKASYSLPDLSPASWIGALNSMAQDGSGVWADFWAAYRKQYEGPSYVPCDGPCKVGMLGFLNGTTL